MVLVRFFEHLSNTASSIVSLYKLHFIKCLKSVRSSKLCFYDAYALFNSRVYMIIISYYTGLYFYTCIEENLDRRK